MDLDNSANENTSMSDSAVPYSPEFNWDSTVVNPSTSSNDDLYDSEEMSLVPPVAVSFGGHIDLHSEHRSSSAVNPFHLGSTSSHETSRMTSDLVRTTLNDTGRESGIGERTSSSTNRLLQLLDGSSGVRNDEEPSNSERNTMNETIRILAANSNIDNDDNSEFSDNHRAGSSTHESSRLRSADHSDNLFAPEDSSSSSETSQLDVQNPFLPLPPTNNYFAFLTNQPSSSRSSTSREERPLLRLPTRFSRPSPFCFSADSDNNNSRDQQLYQSYFGSTRRLSPYISRLRRCYKRTNHSELGSRRRVHWAANIASTSNDGHLPFTEESDVRPPTVSRRHLYVPKLYNEWRHPHTLSENSTARPNRAHERLSSNRSSHLLQSIIEFGNSLRQMQARERARARSVSPTPANPWFPSSAEERSLDDVTVNNRRENTAMNSIGRRFMNENAQEQPRPDSPPTPSTLSDDDCPVIPTTFQGDVLSAKLSTEQTPSTSQQSNNFSMVVESDRNKKVPCTYDDLNNELTQLLECPICFEYSTPPVNQCLQGHVICNNCRQKVNSCPTCRTVFQESRNLLMEKVAALLRYPCKNAVTGCCEALYLLEKERHEMSCGFRQYLCFISPCQWRGYKPELLVHVQDSHESRILHGSSVNLSVSIYGPTKNKWLMSAFDELFCVLFFASLGVLKGCVSYIGDPSKCDNYTYNISVTSEEETLRTFNYSRITHVYDETFENIDMIDSVDLFSITHAQLRLFKKGTKASIRVTVEELPAKIGSGFSSATSSN